MHINTGQVYHHDHYKNGKKKTNNQRSLTAARAMSQKIGDKLFLRAFLRSSGAAVVWPP